MDIPLRTQRPYAPLGGFKRRQVIDERFTLDVDAAQVAELLRLSMPLP